MGWTNDSLLAKAQKKGIERNLFPNLSPDETSIVQALKEENDQQINMLSVKANLPIAQTTALLFELEMKGIIRTMAGGCYHLID